MPKLQNFTDESLFLASVQVSFNKVQFKAKQSARAYEEKKNPEYWKEQRARMQNPKARSYDALTEYIA